MNDQIIVTGEAIRTQRAETRLLDGITSTLCIRGPVFCWDTVEARGQVQLLICASGKECVAAWTRTQVGSPVILVFFAVVFVQALAGGQDAPAARLRTVDDKVADNAPGFVKMVVAVIVFMAYRDVYGSPAFGTQHPGAVRAWPRLDEARGVSVLGPTSSVLRADPPSDPFLALLPMAILARIAELIPITSSTVSPLPNVHRNVPLVRDQPRGATARAAEGKLDPTAGLLELENFDAGLVEALQAIRTVDLMCLYLDISELIRRIICIGPEAAGIV
ncbi:uncharacterized protein BO97DRAFT_428527 [Aspergillus homomorphus CBS 101889]|uniref:Uncharacterized protein n=1 Tax=Aspergillus homomorphus (strain CBS 101889) TaxID=1450537 RepID=A0A395HJY0_ASPHC|nr:hypothetical protein BO97DRAFT_428527 [Aspergillus homomorphus CBS 101889]RAL08221.1 hypothetical protein BO97DRAFT_428527 [Aspergillus homomorphus CBS 101889]